MLNHHHEKFVALVCAGAIALATGASIFAVYHAIEVKALTTSANQTAASSYWSGLSLSDYGSAFRTDLRSIMIAKQTKTGSYDGCKTVLCSSDLDPAGSGQMLGFYDETKLTATWDSAATWNREHVWPNSRGAGTSGPGGDPHMIRPASVSTNSGRGSNMYGYTSEGSNAFDPGNTIEYYRGIAARIIFYTATRWWTDPGKNSNNLELSTDLSDTLSNNHMGNVTDLIAWNNAYPVQKSEIVRNEYLASQGYGRNPFIDNPDYANYIWTVTDSHDSNYMRTASYSGGLVSSSSSTSASTSSTTSTPTTTSSSSTPSSSSSSSSSSASSSSTYQLVTSASDLTIGSNYVVVSTNSGSGYGMTAATKSSYYMGASAVTVTSNAISDVSGLGVYTLGGTSGAYTFQNDSNYLRGYVSGTHYDAGLATSTGTETNWAVTIASDGAATMEQTTDSVYLTYNSSYTEFAGSSSSGTVYLFKEIPASSVAVTGVSLSSSSASIKVGATATLTATVSPSDATNKNVTWSSSDTSVASVSGGVVTGVKAGSATITVTTANGGLQDTCSVSVSNVEATAVTLSASSASLIVGGTKQLSVTFTPSNTTDQSGIWDSSNTTVATVSDTGLVTAKAAGSTTVSFLSNSGNLQADCTVTVSEAVVLSSISVSGAATSATFGSTYSTSGIVVTAHYSDGSTKDVTSSSNISSPNTKIIGAQTPSVSYTEDSLTKSATYSVFVTTVGATQGSTGATTYNLVTSVSSLASGDIVFIAASESDYALGTTQNTSNRNQVAITKDAATNTASFTTTPELLTLGEGTTSGTYSLHAETAEGYLYAASSTKNYLKTQSTNDANGSWTITVTSAGVATITANGSNSHNDLEYNSSASVFSCYASGQAAVALYKQVGGGTQYFTDQEEAEAWSNYFVSSTESNCSSSTIWSDANTQYTNMSTTAKAYFVAHESDNATISAAYTRYSYAVNAHGMTDFIGASGNGAADVSSSNSGTYVVLAAILGVFALTTLGYVGFSYRRKRI
jgi:uncharacterized protein YjdB